jgi:CheY-like chemotaxis protein
MTMTQSILIADHDPRFRECCGRCLQAHGYDTATATDGLQCIELLQSLSPDLLVLDPEILWGGGIGVLDWLREQAPLKPVRVIVTDGHFLEAFPPDLRPLISGRLERPASLSDLTKFVNEIQQHLASDWRRNEHSTGKALGIAAAILRSR